MKRFIMTLVVTGTIYSIGAGVARADCIGPIGERLDMDFVECIQKRNIYSGRVEPEVVSYLKGDWSVNCESGKPATYSISSDGAFMRRQGVYDSGGSLSFTIEKRYSSARVVGDRMYMTSRSSKYDPSGTLVSDVTFYTAEAFVVIDHTKIRVLDVTIITPSPFNELGSVVVSIKDGKKVASTPSGPTPETPIIVKCSK